MDLIIKKGIIIKSIKKLNGSSRGIQKINIDDVISIADRGEGNKEITFNNLKFSIKNKKLIIAQLV